MPPTSNHRKQKSENIFKTPASSAIRVSLNSFKMSLGLSEDVAKKLLGY